MICFAASGSSRSVYSAWSHFSRSSTVEYSDPAAYGCCMSSAAVFRTAGGRPV